MTTCTERACRRSSSTTPPDAFLLTNPIPGGNPFFKLARTGGNFPLVLLATVATIIASQAIITGSFSLTRQAMLTWLVPRIAHPPDLGRGNAKSTCRL